MRTMNNNIISLSNLQNANMDEWVRIRWNS
jgi:hypothetical protein